MRTNKNPRSWEAGRAGQNGYLQTIPSPRSCQDLTPVSCIIRRIFIEQLVSQRYTAKNSLRVDGLLTLAECLEDVNHASCN
jgi:hypothetical protein